MYFFPNKTNSELRKTALFPWEQGSFFVDETGKIM